MKNVLIKGIGIFAILMALAGMALFPHTSFGFALTVTGIVLTYTSYFVLSKKS
jgi:hypothetical protein